MKHRKQDHPNTVRECNRDCKRSDDQCWYRHKSQAPPQHSPQQSSVPPQISSDADFPKIHPKNKPPDSNKQIIMNILETVTKMVHSMQ